MSSLLPSFMSPARCVLLITDDGVGVYTTAGGGVRFLDSYHWRDQGFGERLADAIARSKADSLIILNDAVEQHYRKEKIPILSFFDKANIVQRRLNVAFPNYPMRAAAILKQGSKALRDAAANDKDAVKGDLYLFAAVPSTDAFGRIMTAITQVDVQIVGYGLLPLESTSLVDVLVKKLAQKKFGVGGGRWSILISQHSGGGLRQVVVRDSEIALTRVTPVAEPNRDDPGAWAADVSQELQATLSYLSRFGYVPEDGLDIIVLGDTTYTEALEPMIYAPCNFSALGIRETAGYLGVSLARGADDHLADSIHVGWVARKAVLDLPLSSREISSIRKPRQVALAVMLLASIGVAGVAGYAVEETMKLYRATVNTEVAKIQKKKIDAIYEEELKRKEKMGIDIPLIKGALTINGNISKTVVDPLKVLDVVSRELDNIRLDGLEFSSSGPEPAGNQDPAQPLAPRDADLKLLISFAGSIEPKEGNEEIDKLVARMNTRLESIGYKAEVTKVLQDLTYKGVLNSEVGLTADKRSVQDRYNAEITVKKVQSNG